MAKVENVDDLLRRGAANRRKRRAVYLGSPEWLACYQGRPIERDDPRLAVVQRSPVKLEPKAIEKFDLKGEQVVF